MTDYDLGIYISEETQENIREVIEYIEHSFPEDLSFAIRTNTENRWCVTGNMTPREYIEIANQSKDFNDQDYMFKKLYEDQSLLTKELEDILDDAPAEWNSIIRDAFNLINDEKFRVIIPLLISFLEYKVNALAELIEETQNRIGKRLVKIMDKHQEYLDVERVKYKIFYSVSEIVNSIFDSHKFDKTRRINLNRNWILHGRDNPKEWRKVDIYKLISILSGISFLNIKLKQE